MFLLNYTTTSDSWCSEEQHSPGLFATITSFKALLACFNREGVESKKALTES